MKKLLVLFMVVFVIIVTISCSKKPLIDKEEINSLGLEVDECRYEYLREKEKVNAQKDIQSYSDNMRLDYKIQGCYIKILGRMLEKYYHMENTKITSHIADIMVPMHERNNFIYTDDKKCQPNCGNISLLLGNQATTYDAQKYIIRNLSFLYDKAINASDPISLDIAEYKRSDVVAPNVKLQENVKICQKNILDILQDYKDTSDVEKQIKNGLYCYKDIVVKVLQTYYVNMSDNKAADFYDVLYQQLYSNNRSIYLLPEHNDSLQQIEFYTLVTTAIDIHYWLIKVLQFQTVE